MVKESFEKSGFATMAAILHERRHHAVECRTDHDADGEINDAAAQDELFEPFRDFFEEGHYSVIVACRRDLFKKASLGGGPDDNAREKEACRRVRQVFFLRWIRAR